MYFTSKSLKQKALLHQQHMSGFFKNKYIYDEMDHLLTEIEDIAQ
jgi:hypothetical protein